MKAQGIKIAAGAAFLFVSYKLWKHYQKSTPHEPEEPQVLNPNAKKLWAIFAEEWDSRMRANPELATMLGDFRFNDQLSDASPKQWQHLEKDAKYFLNQIETTIDYKELDAESQLNYDIFQRMLKKRIEEVQFKPWHWQGNQLFGPHLDFARLVNLHPFYTDSDVRAWISRCRAFSKKIDQFIESLQSGIDNKQTLPAYAVQPMISQCEIHVTTPPTDSPFYSPLKGPATKFADDYGKALAETIASSVSVAYGKLAKFLRENYAPHARPEAGLWSLDGGSAYYDYLISAFTTTSLTARNVHDIGLEEVKRIRADIKLLTDKLGFSGSFPEIEQKIKSNPENCYKSRDDIINSYKSLLDDVEKKLPRYFGILPQAKFEIKAVEPYAEKAAPPAYYYPGQPVEKDSKKPARPGFFYANTYEPTTRPSYLQEVVGLHEGLPGHHLQISIAQELRGVPRFRKHSLDFMAYSEGWGLYCELLGKEMGYYTSPMMELGRLNADIWRAVRLVVDTGIHALHWSRDDAIHYFKANTFLPEDEARREIDRYIVFPGQATSYKIGQLKILEAREFATGQLQEKFNYRDFHDQVLMRGALPLDVFDKYLRKWASSKN